jgi:outer membrane protein insertion porin family
MFSRLLIFFLFNVFFVHFSNANVISKIDITGNQRITDDTIKIFADFDIGDEIDFIKIDEILKNLYNTKFFKDVSVVSDKDTLTINVIENPIIQEIIYNGINANKILDEIKKDLILKNRSSYNLVDLENDKQKIISNLKNLGYYFSSLDIYIEDLNDNKVNVNFNINLGNKAKISKISFIGNKIFKDNKLKSLILSEEYKFWKFISGKKYLNESMIEFDKRLLNNFYLNNGFYNVEIFSSFARILESDKNSFELIFNINAGKRVYFDEFNLELPTDYNKKNFEKLQKTFINLKGELYSINAIEKIIESIDVIALNDQFEAIDIKVSEKLIENKLVINFSVEETEKFFVKNINIFGNNVTQESVIRNQFYLDEGDPFNNILLNKTINNLKSLNIFKNVSSEIIDNDNNEKLINIEVEEKPTGEIFASAGVGTSGNTIGFGVNENNFLGKAIKLSSDISLGTDTIKGGFSVTNPNFMNSDKLVYTSLDVSEIDRLSSFGYKTSRKGFSFGTKFEYLDDFRLGIGSQNKFENIETDPTASTQLKKQEDNYFDSLLDLSFDYDKRNQKFRPSKGFRSAYEVSAPIISETNTLANRYNYKHYVELFNENISTFGFFLGASNSLSDEDIKLTERLNLPAKNLRGFEYGKIGPKDGNDFIGGNFATSLNFSSTLPFILQESQNTDFLFFLDMGNVWGVDYNSSLDKSRNRIRSATGIGVDWLTPVGPLNFSFAKPITKADTDKTESFRFNLGTTF